MKTRFKLFIHALHATLKAPRDNGFFGEMVIDNYLPICVAQNGAVWYLDTNDVAVEDQLLLIKGAQ